jgi:D-galactosamine 6-phosphate deaminase/isomerase
MMEMKEKVLSSPLLSLLELSAEEKETRGLRFTPHEIHQQPKTWQSTYKRCIEKAPELKRFLDKSEVGHRNHSAPVVFLVGAGTSDYVGRALTNLLRARWQCDAWAVPSTDLLTNMESLITPGREYLWIAFSRSGDSPEGVAVLEKALATYPQIRHLVITCNENGKMAQICSSHPDRTLALVLDPAVNDRGLAMTSSFTNMVVAGQCVAHLSHLQNAGANSGEKRGEKYGEILAGMSEVGSRFLNHASVCAAEIAAMGCTRACFVGSGALAAVANESALKLLELTAGKVQTLSESALGLRHGPMSAVDENTLFVMFLSSNETRRCYEIDLLKEIREKRLGKVTVVVTPQPDEGLNALADFVISLDAPQALADEYRAPVDIILAQLLGLFFSVHAGLQPDRPSPNSVISRVVSHVKIY